MANRCSLCGDRINPYNGGHVMFSNLVEFSLYCCADELISEDGENWKTVREVVLETLDEVYRAASCPIDVLMEWDDGIFAPADVAWQIERELRPRFADDSWPPWDVLLQERMR